MPFIRTRPAYVLPPIGPPPAPPIPLSVTFTPASPSIPDNTTIGTIVAAIHVVMSDGSAFTGTLGFVAPFNNDGGSFAISGANLVTAAAMPTGVSTQNVSVSATENGTTVKSDLAIGVTASGAGTVLTTLGLTSTIGGAALPSMWGVVIPEGATHGPVSTSEPESFCVTLRTWNDGSVKHVAVITRPTLTVNVLKSIGIIDTPPAAGTNLTSADIAASASLTTAGQNVASLGVLGTVDLSSLLATPIRTNISCPQMVECDYETVIAGIFVSFQVRLFKGGRVRIVINVDSGWIDIANSDKVYISTLKIGGVTVFTRNFTAGAPHFQNAAYTAEAWIGGDPQVLPTHNMPNIVATKLVPNYFMDTPTAAGLNGMTQTYTPFGFGDWTQTMGDTGYAPQIGLLPNWDALCVTSLGDPRAFKSCLANAKSLRSYGITWRGSTDGNLPARASVYPGASLFGGTDTVNTGSLIWEINHHGSGGYLAYLLTADRQYLDVMRLQAASCYFCNNPSQYGFGLSRYLGRQIRGHGWQMRTLGQLAAICPTADPTLNDWRAILDNCATVDLAAFNTPGFPKLGIAYSAYNGGQGGQGRGGGWNRPDGAVYPAGTGGGLDGLLNTDGTISAWMQEFVVATMGYLSDMEWGTSVQMAKWATSRDFHYAWPVGMLGTGDTTPGTGSYCFSFSNQYGLFVVNTTLPNFGDDVITDWFAKDWGTLFANPANKPTGYSSCINTLQGAPATASGTTGNLTLGAGVTAYGWGDRLPSISYAVDHAAPGAQAAYSRLIGASNFTSLRFNTGGTGNVGDFPVWCIQPRDALQALLATMTPGTWKAVPRTVGSRLSDVAYGQNAGDSPSLTAAIAGSDGPTSIIVIWGGAALDTTNKRLFVCNGGHGNYHGNEAYTFDYTTLKWANISKPTDPALNDGVNGGQFMSDGTPAVPHTYGDPTWDPSQNRVMYLGAGAWSGGGTNAAWYINPSTMRAGVTAGTGGTNSWSRLHDWGGNLGGNTQSNADYDPVSGHVWVWGLFSHTIEEYIPGTNTWTAHLDPSGGSADNVIGGTSHPNGFGCIQPGVRAITVGDSQTYEISIAPGTAGKVAKWATTGDHTAENGNAPGAQWHGPSGNIVSWNGGTTLYLISPVAKNWVARPASPFGGLAANIPTAPALDGTFNRFRYLPWANCFSVVNDFNQDVYIYKPDF